MCVYFRSKGIFSRTSKLFLSVGRKLLSFSCFQKCPFWRNHRSQFNSETFPKIISTMAVVCVYLLQNGISSHTSKNYFSVGLKLLRFSYFWKCWLGRDQRSQFNNDTSFNDTIFFFFRVQITHIYFFSGMPICEWSNVTV